MVCRAVCRAVCRVETDFLTSTLLDTLPLTSLHQASVSRSILYPKVLTLSKFKWVHVLPSTILHHETILQGREYGVLILIGN